MLCNVCSFREDIQVEFKKGDKLINCISHWVLIIVEPSAIIENIVS